MYNDFMKFNFWIFMITKFFTNLFKTLIILVLSNNLLIAGNKDKVRSYVDNLLEQSFTILNNSKLSASEKYEQSKKLMAPNLDFITMSKFALGAKAKNLSTQQIQEFSLVYRDYVVASFSKNAKLYNGQKVNISSIKLSPVTYNDNQQFYVATKVIDAQNSEKVMTIVYVVDENPSGELRVFDIIIEGISWIKSQKDQITSLSEHKTFEELISDYKSKIN